MTRTARNFITAFCCTGLMAAAGCSSTGELTVTGMYGSQGQALSGDRCDELLMDAADATTAEEEDAAKAEYRACVEDALDEDGRHGECRDDADDTCDIILDEIGDALHAVREAQGDQDKPDCANPEAGGQTALCHLMAAYEACELDGNGDGDPDVEDRPDEDRPDEDRPDEDRPDEDRPDEDRPDEERPDEDRPGDTNPDEPTEPGEGGSDADPDAPTDADAFCAHLEAEIDSCDNPDRLAELEAKFDRECTP